MRQYAGLMMKLTLRITTKSKLPPCASMVIIVVFDQPLEIHRLEIEDVGTAEGAADWIVNDVLIDEVSQFRVAGDVPGDLFAVNALENFVRFPPGSRIELVVTYIGLEEPGCCFTGRILGKITPDHPAQAVVTARAARVPVKILGGARAGSVVAALSPEQVLDEGVHTEVLSVDGRW